MTNSGRPPTADGIRSQWPLEPDLAFLNHGSFGAAPRPVLEAQRRWRDRMEANPVRFLARDLEEALDSARRRVASFLGADPAGLVFVPNATTAVATALASANVGPGEEILATNHEYNATLNAARRIARRAGASVVTADIPFPLASVDDAVDAVLARITDRTRVALVSHVTSATAIVLPVERIVRELATRGVETIVDGAHAPGMVDLDVDRIGAAWYAANGHKWLCGPKGTAVLVTRDDRRGDVRPLVTSHGANDDRTTRPRLHLEFDWLGTDDPTSHLTLPEAIDFVASLATGGWPAVRRANHDGVVAARRALLDALAVPPPLDEAHLGSMAVVPVPVPPDDEDAIERLQRTLAEEDLVEVPVPTWPVAAARPPGVPASLALLRISWHAYNAPWEVERLIDALARRRPAARRARRRRQRGQRGRDAAAE